VSGWRDHSYFEDSRHKHSQAVDFSIQGVDNTVLRDYVRRFRNCGIGYYPNSSFVHLDVRDAAAYWVDYAGPGEAPRSKPHADSPDKAMAESDGAGPIEEAGGDVKDGSDEASKPKLDVTSGASPHTPPAPASLAPASP
jgi:hypothetical protein